ncbi:CehA/McbA family metallohydrolase [Bacillus timonensis]|nr:CehA/McbA family metallohydrolase [Bacillus timonensis]
MTTFSVQKINGVANTPFISKVLEIDADYDWLKLSITFFKKGWFGIFLWDPNGKLRVQSLYINEPKEILISKNSDATSFSCVSGEIPKGKWRVEILSATYKSEPYYEMECTCGLLSEDVSSEDSNVWATTSTSTSSVLDLNHFDARRVYNDEKKWYKGDFHTHTNESDGKMTPEQGMEQAKKMGLDYFVATDHNILPTKWVKDSVMVIPGIEVTSSKGHFNALGLTRWIDWRPTCEDGGMETEVGMNRILRECREAGAVVSLNHPMLKPWEWQFQETLLSSFDTIEIWNDPTYKDNPKATEEALVLWNMLWNDGHRLFGIGGSDSHLLPTESYEKNGPPSVIGDPATYVLSEGLSTDALLSAVKKGKVYVARGPVLEVDIEVNGEASDLGSDLTATSKLHFGAHIDYSIAYENVPKDSVLYWVQDGEVVDQSNISETGKLERSFSFSQDQITWLRFEIRSKDGELLAFGNPIFQGSKQPTIKTWGQLLERI